MSTKSQAHNQPCTGATYTITATTSGYGALSNIDTLPKKLTALHLSLKPQTPRQDVTAIHQGYSNDEVVTGNSEARLLKVHIELRRGAWSATEKRILVERVHALLVQWRGKKAEKTDVVVQVSEIEDWACVMRNGVWGMWEGAVPANSEAEDGRSERTLVG